MSALIRKWTEANEAARDAYYAQTADPDKRERKRAYDHQRYLDRKASR